MKKNFSYKVSSALMCAAMAGTTVATPIMSQVSANTDESATMQEVMQSDVTGNSINDISVFVNQSTSAIMFDGTQKLETFTRKVLSMTGVELDDTAFRIDWVDTSGLRHMLRIGDTDTDVKHEIQTLSDLYDFVKQQDRETTFVIFTNDGEIARIVLGVQKDGSVLIDTVKGTPDVSYLVRFDANGGELSGVPFVMRAQGEQLSYMETAATYDRHTFDGWYDAKVGGNKIDETTVINSNIRVYAHWIADTYRVTFDTQGGNEIEPKVVSIDEALYNLPTPKKDGYTFLGWYTKADGGDKVISVKDAKDVTLYAHWKVTAVTPDDSNTSGKDDSTTTTPDSGDTSDKDDSTTTTPDSGDTSDKDDTTTTPDSGDTSDKDDTTTTPDSGDTSDKDDNTTTTPDSGDTSDKDDTTTTPDSGDASDKDDNTTTTPDGGNASDKDDTTTTPDSGDASDKDDTTTPDSGDTSDKDDTTTTPDSGDASNKDDTTTTPDSGDTSDKDDTTTTPDSGDASDKDDNTTTTPDSGDTSDKDDNTTTTPDSGDTSDKDDTTTTPDSGDTSDKDEDKDDDVTTLPDSGTTSDGTAGTTTVPDGGNTSTDKNQSNSNTTVKGDTSDNSQSTTETTTPVVSTYKLNMTKADGSSMNVSVKSTVLLGTLTQKLGYTNVSYFSVKTASGSESPVDSNTTMETLAKLADSGDIVLIAYDSAGKAVGSAKVVKIGDNEYNVSLSKDTDTNTSANTSSTSSTSTPTSTPTTTDNSLKGATVSDESEVDGKGKGEGETPKDDNIATPVKTADTSVVSVYGIMGSVMTVLLGVLAAMKRKLS